MSIVSVGDKPLAIPSTPNTSPKGTTPSIKGDSAKTPAQNSELADRIDSDIGTFFFLVFSVKVEHDTHQHCLIAMFWLEIRAGMHYVMFCDYDFNCKFKIDFIFPSIILIFDLFQKF